MQIAEVRQASESAHQGRRASHLLNILIVSTWENDDIVPIQTIPIFGQTSHVLDTLKLPSQYFLQWLEETVGDPTGQLVERHKFVAFADCTSFESFTRPYVAQRYSSKFQTIRPDGCQTFYKGGP